MLKTNKRTYQSFERQVGDAGPILDIMAVMLESISNITVISRTTIAAVYRTAQIVASIPNFSCQNKERAYLTLFPVVSLMVSEIFSHV